MQIVRIHRTVFGLCMKENKKEMNKIEIFTFDFSTMRRINETLGIYLALKQLMVFICKSFASLCCVYLGAAPICYVQDAILKPVYLGSTTVLLDGYDCRQAYKDRNMDVSFFPKKFDC